MRLRGDPTIIPQNDAAGARILNPMRSHLTRLAILAGVVLVAVLPSISAGSTAGIALTGLSVLLAVAVLRVAVTVGSPAEVTVGQRARAHREVLSEMAAPRHPSTAGRPMPRAPGIGVAA